MKIGIDTFGCDHGKSGLGSYLMSFINNLPAESEFEFELFGEEIDRYTYNAKRDVPFSSIGIKTTPGAIRLWHYLYANRFIKKLDTMRLFFRLELDLFLQNLKFPALQ